MRMQLVGLTIVGYLILGWGLPTRMTHPVMAQAPEASNRAAEMTARVDALLAERLQEIGWAPAGASDDAAFLRRAYLDLTGTPPTASQVVEFLQDSQPDKRDVLVDRLLASPAAATHLAETWVSWMLPDENQFDAGGRQGLKSWLRNRFAENLRYDRLVSDLLVSSGPPQSGPTIFFVALEGKPEKIAAKTARVFLGVQLDCAECHDHPFDAWSQKDFWGFAAYFAQLSTAADQAMMGQGEVRDVESGDVMLPGTEQIIPPKPLVATGFSGLGSGTRRQQLTLWLTARENPFVARAAVNRVWSLLYGRGLIEPIDDMRNLEMASHPQLLRELSEYFAATGYDLRLLIATLAKTEAYRRASRHESGPPPDASYATMINKPLTEAQLAASLAQVARQIAGENDEAQAAALRLQLGKLRGDASEAKLGMVSALVTLHGTAFDQVSREGTSRLLKALDAPFLDSHQQLRWLFLSTLAREPTADEVRAFSDLLTQSAAQPASPLASPGETAAAQAEATKTTGEDVAVAPATAADTVEEKPADEKPADEKPADERAVDESGAETNAGDADADAVTPWQSDLLWALINSTEFAMTP